MSTAYDVKTTAYIVFKILLIILKERHIIIQATHIKRRKFSIYNGRIVLYTLMI